MIDRISRRDRSALLLSTFYASLLLGGILIAGCSKSGDKPAEASGYVAAPTGTGPSRKGGGAKAPGGGAPPGAVQDKSSE